MAAIRLIEAMGVVQKWREVDHLVQSGQQQIGRAFAAQGRAVMKAFMAMRPYFVEEAVWLGPFPCDDIHMASFYLAEASPIPDDEWSRLWAMVARNTLSLMLAPLVDMNELGLQLGAGALAATLGVDPEKAFSLKNPRAVAYLEKHGADLVTEIFEETRSQMKVIVTRAAKDGWSYTRTAKEIKNRFDGFAGLKPQRHIRDRATLVAVTEVGQAYEEGSRIVALGLEGSGVPMQKFWRTSGDERVSAGCKDNQAAGWLSVRTQFPSGHDRPLRFPGCRCSALYRRAR